MRLGTLKLFLRYTLMRVLTRTQPWCRNLALPRLRVQQSGLCVPAVRARYFSAAARTHGEIIAGSKRGAQRQNSANCRLSHLGSPSVLPSLQLRHCSSVHMASLATPGASDEYRLPTTVKPTHYDVTIKTDLENQDFEGFVHIE